MEQHSPKGYTTRVGSYLVTFDEWNSDNHSLAYIVQPVFDNNNSMDIEYLILQFQSLLALDYVDKVKCERSDYGEILAEEVTNEQIIIKSKIPFKSEPITFFITFNSDVVLKSSLQRYVRPMIKTSNGIIKGSECIYSRGLVKRKW